MERIRKKLVLLFLTALAAALMAVPAFAGDIRWNVSYSVVTGNTSVANLPEGRTEFNVGDKVYFNFQGAADVKYTKAEVYIRERPNGAFQLVGTDSADNTFIRYSHIPSEHPYVLKSSGNFEWKFCITYLNSSKPIEYEGKIFTVNPPIIIEGNYNLITDRHSGKALDVDGNSSYNRAKIQIWDSHNGPAQTFKIHHVGGGWHTIKHISSGNVLSVEGGSTNPGVKVVSWEEICEWSQLWRFEPSGNGYRIKSALGCYLDVSGGRTENGTQIQVWTGNGDPAQLWHLLPNGSGDHLLQINGRFQLRTALDGGKALDVAGGSREDKANVQIYSANGTEAQNFSARDMGNGWYEIYNTASGKVLDVSGGIGYKGANVIMYRKNDGNNQLWKFVQTAYGIVIKSKTGYTLDVSGGNSSDTTNVQVWLNNDSAAQRWYFVPSN